MLGQRAPGSGGANSKYSSHPDLRVIQGENMIQDGRLLRTLSTVLCLQALHDGEGDVWQARPRRAGFECVVKGGAIGRGLLRGESAMRRLSGAGMGYGAVWIRCGRCWAAELSHNSPAEVFVHLREALPKRVVLLNLRLHVSQRPVKPECAPVEQASPTLGSADYQHHAVSRDCCSNFEPPNAAITAFLL
eukprot:3166393-Pleurochrysis_carterae.AAC.1